MLKKKVALFTLLLFLPSSLNVLSCNNKKITVENNEKVKNDGITINELKENEEMKEINFEIGKIKNCLKDGIDGSDFTPSQSMADITVQQDIIKKIKKICNNPENIKFVPQFKSKYFKVGDENYVNVEIIYTKKDFQFNSMHCDLQIKNIKQNLEELVNQTIDDLKSAIDFSNSFLMEDDNLQIKIIENELINVLKNKIEHDDERLEVKLVNKNAIFKNHHQLEIEVIGKDDKDTIIKKAKIIPINLKTLDQYVAKLTTKFQVTRKDQLFANIPGRYEQCSWTQLNSKIHEMFIKSNSSKFKAKEFWRSEHELLSLDLITDGNSFVTLKKGETQLDAQIKLEFNRSFRNIKLTLENVEDHPKYVLDEITNYFVHNWIDLANEPVFKDSDFESDEIKAKIKRIIEKQKSRFEGHEDIDVKIEFLSQYSKLYCISFSHKNPQIIGLSSLYNSEYISFKNIQTSPRQDLATFMSSLSSDFRIKIPDINIFNNVDTTIPNLLEGNVYLRSALNYYVRNTTEFGKLSNDAKNGLEITSVRLIAKRLNEIELEYTFEFQKSGEFAVQQKRYIFY